MKKIMILNLILLTFIFGNDSFGAENINGRFGITGKVGFIVPTDSDIAGVRLKSGVGITGGGGFIYGVTDNVAAEFTVTRSESDTDALGTNSGSTGTTDISVGAQYRFETPIKKLYPFVGGGLDVIYVDLSGDNGRNLDVDTAIGLHLKGGVDYFILPQMALTGELKGILAPDVDINNNGVKVGNFDPNSFSMTFGLRYFFN